MGLELQYIPGQTALDEDEKEGLLIESITTHRELDEFEQLNIIQAVEWTLSRKLDREYILSEGFVRELYKNALKEADKGNIKSLIEFARS